MKIEKGIPLPAHGNTKYPFADMVVGDSFLMSIETHQKLRVAANAYGKRHAMKFSVRVVESGVRCWRVA